ncbi:MAG: hypothetical protein ABEH88_02395 [Halobacteriales archaeon]
MRLRRREVLAAGVVAALAGCVDGDDPEGGSPTEVTKTESPTDTADLDLREANVTGVELEPTDGRTFDVGVTLIHDDDGEEGYANWWQAETLDGERLGRRDLSHAHGTREFTRSADIDVPEDVSCVVVRGHDRTHQYGGQAMLVDVDSGETTARRQGVEPIGFSSADCPYTG